jgi:hypothetical protein
MTFGIRTWLFAIASIALLPGMLLAGDVGRRWAESERVSSRRGDL